MDFLGSALSFPTVIFSFFLCVCVVLWLLTMLGLLGFEAADVDVDADLDLGDLNLAGNHGSAAGEAMGLLSRFGLNGVPITLMVTLLSLYGWMSSFILQSLVFTYVSGIPVIYYLAGAALFIFSFIVSVFMTAKTCKPLRGIFKNQDAISNKHLIGRTAVVRSLKVNENFGEAIFEDGGAGLILQIRAYPAQGLKSGDKVVLLEYQSETTSYRVISEEEFKGI